MMFPYLDPTIVLLIPAVLFSLWAQFKVRGAFSRYSEVSIERRHCGSGLRYCSTDLG